MHAKWAIAVALLCCTSAIVQAKDTAEAGVYGFWAKTLGSEVLDEIANTKKQLEGELEKTKASMLELAESQMHMMLDKIKSGEMDIEDEIQTIGLEENANVTEHRELAFFEPQPPKPTISDIFQGDLLGIRKPDFSRCTFFGGREICLPAKRYYVRKSISFACDMYLKKNNPGQFFECGRPGSTTALCLDWPIELVVSSFVVPITVPICLPDARAIDAILRVLGGDIFAAINLLL